MLEQRLTTEFYEDTLSVVIFDTVGCFVEPLSSELLHRNIEVIQLPLTNLENNQIYSVLENAYKVVVVLSPAASSESWAQQLMQLQPFQDKVTVMLPVISAFSEQVTGEIPYLAQYLASQQLVISLCNEALPQANFIFGQDTILPLGYYSLFEILCQSIQKGYVFAPNTVITPVLVSDFCRAAAQELFRPNRLSALIKGRTRYAYKLLENIALQYEGYYFCQVGLQKVAAQEVQTIPFTVKEITLPTDEDTITLWFSRQLPSPETPLFFNTELLSFLTAQSPESTAQMSSTMDLPALPLYEPDRFEPWLEQKTNPTTKMQTSVTETFSQVFSLDSEQSTAEQVSSRRNRTLQLTNLHSITTATTQPEIVDEFNVSTEIQRIFSSTRQEQLSQRVNKLVHEKTVLTKKSKKKTTLFYGGLGFVSIGGGVLFLMLFFMTTTYLLKQQVFALLKTPTTQTTQRQFQRVQFSSSLVAWQAGVYSKLLEVPQLEEARRIVAVEQQLSTMQQPETQSSESLKKLYATLMGTSTGDVGQLAENMTAQTLTNYEAATIVEQSLQHISFSDESAATALTDSYQKKVSQFKKQAVIMQQLQPILGNLLGLNGRRSYAFVLQNNQELRPTGGFMDAVAVITLENGTMVDRTIYTSYELDKKMSGTVAAPAEITRALGQKTFSIYDANWSPDYPTSAATIEWFLEKILNRNIDGVMTIDLYGIQRILEATGPLELPEYNEVITSKNLLERLEFHSEVVLLETEKNHDYRKVLFSHLLDKLVQLPAEKVVAVTSAYQESLTAKSALVAFSNPQEKQTMQNLGWSGAQVTPQCPSEFSKNACIVDQMMQVEANVGVNKANYYLKRAIKHTIAVSPTQADHTQQVTFENTAQLDAWPKGSYRTYIRFYLPSSAKNIGLTVGEQQIPDLQLIKTQENGLLSVGYLMEVPIKSTIQVTLKYTTPLTVQGNTFSYVFFNNEQPGNGDTPYSLEILPTAGLVPQVVAPQAQITPSSIVFTRNNDESSLYAVEFTQAK